MRTSKAFPIVVSGPSGVGKTTLVARLLEADPELVESISTTTRAPRDGEISGTDYFFVTRDVFEEMKERELIEWAEVHDEFYGTPRRFVAQELAAGKDVILNIDIQGGDSVRKAFPNAATVFILPPSFVALEERIRGRGDLTAEAIETRLKNARQEIKACVNYSYIVVNGDLDTAVQELQAIVTAERCRRERKDDEFVENIGT